LDNLQLVRLSLPTFSGWFNSPGNKQERPVNFVLLGHARCGSTLLLRALAEHSQIRMLGEILANQESIRKHACSWANPACEPYAAGQDGAGYLERTVFGPTPVEGSWAFGFKLFYDQARFDEHVQTAWDYLRSNDDVRVIHLVRRNLFDALVSLEVAERTQRWLHLIEDEAEKFPALPPFELEPAACLAYFERLTAWRVSARRSFAGHDVLTVEYESGLCGEFRDTMSRIFEFLAVTSSCCRPGLLKQQTVTAAQQIANFEELRSYFRHTPYESFFRDADSPDGIGPATTLQNKL
jgi:LPS sulfotransferase NodH